jgi:nitrogen fixation protein NifU and related proteins
MHDMYTEIILDYYRHPKNYGRLKAPDSSAHDVNPLCGDEIEIHLNFGNEKLKDIKFIGKGCAISQASASMLTETVKGKKIKELVKINREDVLKNLGINISAARLKCAMLGLKVFKIALYTYMGHKMSDEEKKELY